MDNLTHTLIGALVAETAVRVIPAARSVLPAATRRNVYMALMVVGSNLPDADFVYTSITGGKLGYLLHHRGHTHTLIGAVVLAGLLYLAAWAWLRWRRMPSTATDRRWLAFIAMLAPLLHLCMDATNEYGIHPFWPFNNVWLYGDAIFIVEPLFWAAAAPLVFLLRGPIARVLMGLILLLAAGLSFGSGLVPLPMAASLTLLIGSLLVVAWRASARAAAMTGLAATFAIVCTFVFASQLASRQATTLAAAQFPNATLLDHVLAPLPVNPLCWELILVQLEAERYTLREATLALAPAWFSAERCAGSALDVNPTIELAPMPLADTRAVQWQSEATMALPELQALIQTNCEAAAFTRFARALWIMRQDDGWLVGDLRYDREQDLGFAELAVPAMPAQCPRYVPPWTPPRADLLGKLPATPREQLPSAAGSSQREI